MEPNGKKNYHQLFFHLAGLSLLFLVAWQYYHNQKKILDFKHDIGSYYFLNQNLKKILMEKVDCFKSFNKVAVGEDLSVLYGKSSHFKNLRKGKKLNGLKIESMILDENGLSLSFKSRYFLQKLGPFSIHFEYDQNNMAQMMGCHF